MNNPRDRSTLYLFAALIVGLFLLLYPAGANYWNKQHQTRSLNTYTAAAADLSSEDNERMIKEAEDYNAKTPDRENMFVPTEEQAATYEDILDISGTGIMGYIDIPSIKVTLPIYHTTADTVLQIGIGHVEWSAFPVGGEGTHSVLSGHRGLPSAKLFSDLDKVKEGELFTITILDQVFTYEVDQTRIVLPNDVQELIPVPGMDLCTLVTCTPYGINTHRLLVRGHRTENIEERPVIYVTSEAFQIDPLIVSPIVAAPMLLALFILLMVKTRKKKK